MIEENINTVRPSVVKCITSRVGHLSPSALGLIVLIFFPERKKFSAE